MAEGTDGGAILQVVSGDGSFNTSGVEQFVKVTGVETAGVGYSIVAIMGPQSSGKSTLLNHLVRRAGLRMHGLARGSGWQPRQPGAGRPLLAAVIYCLLSLRCPAADCIVMTALQEILEQHFSPEW